MRQWLSKVMYGRYGGDNFGRFLSFASFVPLLAALAVPGWPKFVLWGAAVGVIGYQYFRMFSRRTDARRRENAWYMKKRQAVTGFFAAVRGWIRQGRSYRFFRCPKCHVWLRVPRGRGKIRVTCRGCNYQFIKKS